MELNSVLFPAPPSSYTLDTPFIKDSLLFFPKEFKVVQEDFSPSKMPEHVLMSPKARNFIEREFLEVTEKKFPSLVSDIDAINDFID